MAEKLTSRHYDIGRLISGNSLMTGEIAGYTMNQSRIYMGKSLELIGITELLLREYIKTGSELVKHEKLKNYAGRKISSMISGRGSGGAERHYAVSAITCKGYCFCRLPEGYRIIRMSDDYIAASQLFVRAASKAANKLGYDTIISRAIDSESAPLHLVIPELKTAFVSETPILGTKFENAQKISFERFYNRSIRDSQEHSTEFFGEYIRKMYDEAALYARISMDIKNQGRKILMPYISEKETAEIASEIVCGILNE